ncbi:F-box protein [Actinidia chinensis var. chinensis]|uniref:F-box protein n=1 Tax=Actinidia chinensis var. chinensis TaxID=1590841 RepID=A0A2R6PGP2_ACTCC|nr:F-box protein [Actinidia chinensis var. chinensis]
MDKDFSDTKENEVHNSNQSGPPHEALFLAIAYLPLFELLAVSEVCRSLRHAVNTDIIPWLDIIVKKPLNLRVSDEILMKIASKANGRLRSLALINCAKITDDGLLLVLEQNPLISKLYVPACTGLTPDGVVRAVKTLTRPDNNAITLKINGIYNIKKEHLDTLHSILGTTLRQQEHPTQHGNFYHKYKNFTTFKHKESDPGLPIDIDICLKCDQARMVFDCPRRNCECRGCYYCIPRCVECGRCVECEELGDTVCADTLCLDCWIRLPKCNFCNRTYCNQHANEQQCNLPGSLGFVCDACQMKALRNSYD